MRLQCGKVAAAFVRRTVTTKASRAATVASERATVDSTNYDHTLPNRPLCQPTYVTHPQWLKRGELQPGVHQRDFADRRARVIQRCAEEASTSSVLVLLHAPPVVYMAPDVPYPYRQSAHVLYMCGYREPGSVLAVYADGGGRVSTTLFVSKRIAHKELWDGPMAGVDDARTLTGVDEVYEHDHFDKFIAERFHSTSPTKVFFNPASFNAAADRTQNALSSAIKEKKLEYVKSPFFAIDQERLIKSPAEQAIMRSAGRIGAAALTATMHAAATRRPCWENDMVGMFDAGGRARGAHGLAYPPVVAGGDRANILHYMACDQTIDRGQMVLMDAGVDYWGYVSDITRTWPVHADWSPAQIDLYDAVLQVHESCISYVRTVFPLQLNNIHLHMNEQLAAQLIRLGILEANADLNTINKTVERLCPHHVSHYLGMDVHDCATVSRGRDVPAGAVFTIEPGLYIRADDTSVPAHFRGIGIRIEDDVLYGVDGAIEVLSDACPRTIDDIRAVINGS